VFALAGDSTMTSRRPPFAVSLVGDNFALLSGRRSASPRRSPGVSGHGDAAECDGTSRPRVKREKPATATRTVTRLPPFLPPGPSRGRPAICGAQPTGYSGPRLIPALRGG